MVNLALKGWGSLRGLEGIFKNPPGDTLPGGWDANPKPNPNPKSKPRKGASPNPGVPKEKGNIR